MFPYILVRTWHVQLAIFWVATSFVAAGIFLVPMISGGEPRGQHALAYWECPEGQHLWLHSHDHDRRLAR